MGKIVYDVTESDPDEAEEIAGSFESPRPGMYCAIIREVTAKGSGGDPDKPMIEVVLEMAEAEKEKNEQYVGSRVWDYVLLPGHPSFEGFVVTRLDNFLLAAGVATKSRKRKGSFDPDTLIDEYIGVIVKADKNLDGDYRGKVASYFLYDEETFGQGSDEDEDDTVDEDLPETDDDEGEDEGEDEGDEEGAEDEDEELPPYEEWSLAELKEEAENRELVATGTKAKIVARLEKDDEEAEEEGDDPFEDE